MIHKPHINAICKTRLLNFSIILISLTITQSNIQAQEYMIGNYVFSNGCSSASNGNYKINNTLGQTHINFSYSDSFVIRSGVGHNEFGVFCWRGFEFEDTNSIDGINQIPTKYELGQNYPNPFNPVTQISFSLPRESHVRINVYNLLGQLTETITDQQHTAGLHSVLFDGSSYTSGIYFYRIEADDFMDTKKMMILK